MFADPGFFHFVFANFDDKYYTDNLLCLNFDAYLWYMLKKDGYSCIVRLYNNGADYMIEYTGINLDDSVLPKKKGFFDKLFSSQEETDFDPVDPTVQKKRIGHLRFSDMNAKVSHFIDLIRQSEQLPNAAFILSVEDFCELCNNETIKKQFMAASKSKKRNCTILLSKTDATYCDQYFVKKKGSNNPFFDTDFFPDIERAFNPGGSNNIRSMSYTKLVFTYDILAYALKNRMHLMNKMTRLDMLNMVRYESIRSSFSDRMVSPELIVALIRIWYGNSAFRKKYSEDSPFVNLPNQRRMRSELASVIHSLKLYLWMEMVVQKEGTSDPNILYMKWTVNDRYAYVGYFTDGHIYPSISALAEKLRNVVVSHQYRIGDDIVYKPEIDEDEAEVFVSSDSDYIGSFTAQFGKPISTNSDFDI